MGRVPGKKQLENMVKKGMTQEQIANAADVTQGAVSKAMKKYKIDPNYFKSTGRSGGTGCTCGQPSGHLPNCGVWGRK